MPCEYNSEAAVINVTHSFEFYISFQNGVVTIPKSTKPERVHENCQVSLYLDLKAAIFMQKKKNVLNYNIKAYSN